MPDPIKVPGEASRGRDSSADLEIRKAELEIRLLEEQLTPVARRRQNLQTIAGASGLIIAFATVLGGFLSVIGWFDQRQRDYELRVDERLDKALTLLSAERPSQRLAGISSLRSFLQKGNDDQNTQVLISIINAIPIEQNPPVLSALVSFLEDVRPDVVSKSTLNVSLQSLVHANRGLLHGVAKGFFATSSEMYATLERTPALEGTARAISAFTRIGGRVNDLSEVYLGEQDLSGLDLEGANLSESILMGTNFSHANLKDAIISDADLRRSDFTSADLRGANLTQERWRYITMQLSKGDLVMTPYFKCADLRAADFTGHPLFFLGSNAAKVSMSTYFWGANIEGTSLDRMGIVSVGTANEIHVPVRLAESLLAEETTSNRKYLIGVIDPEAAPDRDVSEFINGVAALVGSFEGSNWSRAKLPRSVRMWLTAAKPPEDPSATDGLCDPRAPW